jgi:hypothetical protein
MRYQSLAVLMLLLAGCSDGNGDDLTVEEFRAAYKSAYCERVFRCCDADERSFGSTLSCESLVEQRLLELLRFTGASGNVYASFLPAAAKSCLEELRTAGCDYVELTEKGCAEKAVSAPQHTQGEECTYSVECDSYYCIQPAKLVRGSCGAAGGPPCSGDDRTCRERHYCDESGQCQPTKGNAERCGSGRECESGVCSPSTKTCIPRPSPFCDGK